MASDLLSPDRARKLLAEMAKRDFDRVARAVRTQEGRARGIRAVPRVPGPEFRPNTYACDERPVSCAACALRCEWFEPSEDDEPSA